MFQFWWFCGFFPIQLSVFTILINYFIYCNEILCEFLLILIADLISLIYYFKSLKSTYFGPIFGGGVLSIFIAILPTKLSLIILKPFWIDVMVKNRIENQFRWSWKLKQKIPIRPKLLQRYVCIHGAIGIVF